MSIQSEITRVSGEVTTQTELIRQIKEALEGKGAGSGGGTIVKEISFNELNDIVLNQLDSLKDRLILIKVSGDDEFCLQKFFYGNDILSASSLENEPIAYGGQVDAINYAYQVRNYFVAYTNAYFEIQNADQTDILFVFDPAYQNLLDADPIYGLSAQYYILQSENNTPDTPDTPSAPTVEQATPEISVNPTKGLITATATQEEGLVPAGTKTATLQLPVQAAQTITPSTADKTIASGRYLTGTQTIKGDPNLVAENIKSGVSIFGVNGSLKSVDLSAGFLNFIKTQGQSKAIESPLTGIPLNAICYLSCTQPYVSGILDANVTGVYLGGGNDTVTVSKRVDGSMSIYGYEDGSATSVRGTIWWYVP